MSPPPGGGVAAEYDEQDLGKVFDMRLMRRLGRYLHPYRGLVLVAIALSLSAAGLRVVGPWIARHIIDQCIPALTPESRTDLTHYTLLYLGLIAALFIVNFCLAYVTAWVGQQAMRDLRRDIFKKLNALSLKFFDRNPSGRLLTRTTSDVNVLNELFAQGVVNIFADLTLLAGIVVVWFWFDWRLALLLVLTGPLLGLAAYNFRIRARTAYRAVRVRLAAMNAYLQENLAGIRTVQAFHREARNLEGYKALNAPYRDAQIDTVRHYARFFPTVQLVSALATVMVLIYGGWITVRYQGGGEPPLSAGDFYLYFQYIGWFFMPITDLAERYNVFQSAMASSERIFKLLDEPIEVAPPEEPIPAETLEDAVEMRDAWFAYKKEDWVLKGVDLKVEKGRTVALVGATGAGKSTVINLFTRLYDVQKGAVLFNGRDVREYDPRDLRRRMAVVLQDVFLFSGTIAENIGLGDPEIRRERIVEAARYVNADHFIERLPGKYDNEVLERGATLSVGQKQLLAFARAVAHDPDLLILDEATANIDTETEALIQDALARLLHDRTCIVVAHRLSTIQNADNIVVFHHGRIHEQGTHQELLASDGLYRRLYELQYQA